MRKLSRTIQALRDKAERVEKTPAEKAAIKRGQYREVVDLVKEFGLEVSRVDGLTTVTDGDTLTWTFRFDIGFDRAGQDWETTLEGDSHRLTYSFGEELTITFTVMSELMMHLRHLLARNCFDDERVDTDPVVE